MKLTDTIQPVNQLTIFWLKIGLLVTVYIFSYFDTITSLVRTWSERDDYLYGFLVPFISLYFVWYEREKLIKLPIKPNMLGGLILMLIATLIHMMGKISSISVIQQFSIIVMTCGFVLILLGIRYLKALFLPLAYLVLMIPFLDLLIFIDNIHWPFQLFGATVAEKLLNIFDIPVLRRVQFLELPGVTLEVANECSGVRYLVSIIALGIPLTFLTQENKFRKILLIALAVTIGILANPIRIAFIGIWNYNHGGNIHGPFHIFQGLFVSGLGFIFLFISVWVLNKIPSTYQHPKKVNVSDKTSSLRLGVNKSPNWIKQFNRAWITAIFVLIFSGGFLYLWNPLPIPLNMPLNELPLTIGDWKGKEISYNIKPFSINGIDSEIFRVYRNSSGREVELYIGYFEFQKNDKDFDDYKLQKLYEYSEEAKIMITSNSNIRVNKAIVKDRLQSSLILYWYNLNGQNVADRYNAKFLSAINGLLHRRTNGAIIIISSNLNNPDEMGKILNDEIEFVKRLYPILEKYFP